VWEEEDVIASKALVQLVESVYGVRKARRVSDPLNHV
jgi:hypothetical protein